MAEISVKRATGTEAVIQVLNVEFLFVKFGDRVKMIARRKPYAQTHDPAACWVPKNLYADAFRLAVKLLSSPRPRDPESSSPYQLRLL